MLQGYLEMHFQCNRNQGAQKILQCGNQVVAHPFQCKITTGSYAYENSARVAWYGSVLLESKIPGSQA